MPPQTGLWDGLRSEALTRGRSGDESVPLHMSSAKHSVNRPINDNDADVPGAAFNSTARSKGRGSRCNSRRRQRVRYSSSSDTRHSISTTNKSVSFAPAVRVHLTLGRWELTPEETLASWVTSDDTRASQDAVLDTVRAMRKILTDDVQFVDAEACLVERGYTFRGVEHMRSRESIAARRSIKLDVVDAVLEEQHRQRSEGVDNPVSLAEASMLVSKHCRSKAVTKGAEDAAFSRALNRRRPSHKSKKSKINNTTTSRSSSSSKRATKGDHRKPIVQEDWTASVLVVSGTRNANSTDISSTTNSRGRGVDRSDMDEVGSLFTNISHQKLKEKLLQRVASTANNRALSA